MSTPSDDGPEAARALFLRGLASVPRSLVPSTIGDMVVDAPLLADYSGHYSLLKVRALHSPRCYPHWDALRDCIVGRVEDQARCDAAKVAYESACGEDVARNKRRVVAKLEQERRQALNARAREMEKEAEKRGAAGAPP